VFSVLGRLLPPDALALAWQVQPVAEMLGRQIGVTPTEIAPLRGWSQSAFATLSTQDAEGDRPRDGLHEAFETRRKRSAGSGCQISAFAAWRGELGA